MKNRGLTIVKNLMESNVIKDKSILRNLVDRNKEVDEYFYNNPDTPLEILKKLYLQKINEIEWNFNNYFNEDWMINFFENKIDKYSLVLIINLETNEVYTIDYKNFEFKKNEKFFSFPEIPCYQTELEYQIELGYMRKSKTLKQYIKDYFENISIDEDTNKFYLEEALMLELHEHRNKKLNLKTI